MAYKVIVVNTFYVEAGSEAEARLRVIGDLAGVGSENMLVTEIGEEFLEGGMVCYAQKSGRKSIR